MGVTERDVVRDALRDQTRDAERDEDRDAESAYETSVGRGFESIRARKDHSWHNRDETRDRKRDEDRDTKRDESRDGERDQLRDAARDRRRDESAQNATSSSAHDDVPLIVAMAEECGELISAWDKPPIAPPASLQLKHPIAPPASLQLKHLEWMCNRVAEQADTWPKTKLHRWIGFIQAGMIANRLLQLEGAKRMFDRAKEAHPGFDQDLLDHLDPDDCFELDIGGEG